MNSRILVILTSLGLLYGCQSSHNYHNSSAIEFLYSADKYPIVYSEIPKLSLPLKVGIAFTPSSYGSVGLTEKSRFELMASISDHFKSLDFVEDIKIIPSAYLQPRGGFKNLDQLKRMFNIDVIALVSFDQTLFTDQGIASLAYWTIVGAYIVPAEKNSTHTMLDLVLYDIGTRKMLLRAPGISGVKSHSTLVNLTEQTRHDSLDGFSRAGEDLVSNLKIQLALFREKVRNSPEEFQVEKRPGYRGSGSTGLLMVLIAFGLYRKISRA